MTTLAFDGRVGASGDMLLGTLLDAGANPSALDPVEAALDVTYSIDTTVKCGIEATTVRVLLDEAAAGDHGHSHSGDAHSHDHDHGDDDHYHDDHGDDDHNHNHDDHDHKGHSPDNGTPAEGHGPHRSYQEVIEIVEGMGLPAGVEADATEIFRILGEAEASVHGTDLSEIHFHEVGADDAIADIVGVALLIDDLGIDRVVTTPPATGGGTVEMSHGTYPVPGPAVTEIATRADWPLGGGPVDRELLTPTGAAILAHYAEGVSSLPTMDVDAVGYGAGGYDLDPHPNVLRGLLGTESGGLTQEEIAVLETNLDDASPEVLGGLQSRLQDAGARDVTVVPTTGKKSRPGHLVKVIARPADAERVARALAEETGTLGVRKAGAQHRWIAHRRFETAAIEIGGQQYDLPVKVATDEDGQVYDLSAEYDDAAALAAETGRPVRNLLRRAEETVARTLEMESDEANDTGE